MIVECPNCGNIVDTDMDEWGCPYCPEDEDDS